MPSFDYLFAIWGRILYISLRMNGCVRTIQSKWYHWFNKASFMYVTDVYCIHAFESIKTSNEIVCRRLQANQGWWTKHIRSIFSCDLHYHYEVRSDYSMKICDYVDKSIIIFPCFKWKKKIFSCFCYIIPWWLTMGNLHFSTKICSISSEFVKRGMIHPFGTYLLDTLQWNINNINLWRMNSKIKNSFYSMMHDIWLL